MATLGALLLAGKVVGLFLHMQDFERSLDCTHVYFLRIEVPRTWYVQIAVPWDSTSSTVDSDLKSTMSVRFLLQATISKHVPMIESASNEEMCHSS